jgi:predicted ribosome quality control (RQC) complex YloA/Tae2 family protein
VSQVGTDRIIQFEFSDGMYRLFWEFYASGNIVLVDKDQNVLALQRNVNEGAEHERLRVGLTYNLSMRQNYGGVPPLTRERVKLGLQKAVDRQQDAENAPAKKSKKNTKDALRKGLAISINEFPPMLVDHAMRVRKSDSTLRPDEVLASEELLDKLLGVLEEAQKVITEITAQDTVKGYILAKGGPRQGDPPPEAEGSGTKPRGPPLKYDDFHPFKPKQYEDDDNIIFLEFDGFNKTVDEFYSSIEGQKLESRLHEREEAARKKLEQTKKDHQKRIGGLQQVQELNVRKAEAITANVERVQEVQAAVNGLIAQGLDWVDIAKLIEREQSHNNPIAKLIKLPLKLHENTVTMLLGEAEAEDEDGSDSASATETESESESDEDADDKEKASKTAPKPAQDKILAIDIDLGQSAWTNASQYYDEKKSAVVKETKTLQSSSIALKSAERKIAADLKKGLNQEKEVLRPVRKAIWFEKFHYFISSDGYLVLGGKDAQQNEILYRRYLRKGDVYVHADINGASSVIIKNNPSMPDAPIPPSTLSQAGTLVVATSSAWDSKALMSAWWVNADQVSKTAPTGEFLNPGSFTINGKKNFLPPAQMLLGFALMFNISEESKPRHQKHRIITPQSAGLESSMMDVSEDASRAEESRDAANDSEDDSDEEFPDAKLDAVKEDSDDDDFPDATLDATKHSDAEEPTTTQAESEPDSDDEDAAPMKNPLQSGYVASDAHAVETSVDSDVPGEAIQDTASIAGTDVTDMTNKTSSRHLSAKERRLLRKGIDPSTVAQTRAQDHEGSQDDGTDSAAPSVMSTQPKNHPLPRGKRGKQKKAAAKYAYQDEEDRHLAMQILGSKVGQEAAAAEAAARKAKELEAEAQKQRRREQHLKAQAVGLAEEKARQAALQGANDDGEAEEGEDNIRLALLGLDAFIGRPLPGDELLSAIPVCAPWSALSTYKYKAKLQPGATKKGKAVNEILGRWQAAGLNAKIVDSKSEDVDRIWPREVELVKGMKGVEVNGVVPVTKVRVMMAGGSAGGKGGANSASGKGKGNGKSGGRGGRGSKKKK